MTIQKDLIKDNLYLAVNQDWLEEAEIADDKVATGGFLTVRDDIEELMMEEVNRMDQGQVKLEDDSLEEFVAFYRLAKDFESIDQAGASPIRPLVEKILALSSFEEFDQQLLDLVQAGSAVPFDFSISPHMKDTSRYSLYLHSPSIILPEKGYYGTDEGDQLLELYRAAMLKVLSLVGFDSAEAEDYIEQALTFDDDLSQRVKSREEAADYAKNFNPRTLDQVDDYSQAFSFQSLFKSLINSQVDEVIVTHPEFFEDYGSLVDEKDFDQLKAWMLVRTIQEEASYLSEDIRQAMGTYSLALSGQSELQSRDKHAYYASLAFFDQPLGIYYGKKYFGPRARADVEEMIDRMVEIYKNRLSNNSWLSQTTIARAIEKLDALIPLIAYPEDYIDLYRQFKVDPTQGFYANYSHFQRLTLDFQCQRWNQEVDRSEWGMSAVTVNAYFNPNANVICFPAAILQAPFYDFNQSRSENFGGIGAVIAHEISHAFDNNGAKFDEKGNMNNWWQEEDFAHFEAMAEQMVECFDGLEAEAGPVNGRLTVSENIADQGGLAAAYEAMIEEDQADPQAFFINWAKIWCKKSRPEYARLLLKVDVHAPNEIRANRVPQLLDGFHQSFDTQPGDGMYLAPEDRLIIW